MRKKLDKAKWKEERDPENIKLRYKVDKVTEKLNKANKRLSEIEDDYNNSSKKINSLLKEIGDNTDYMYRTYPWTFINLTKNDLFAINEGYFDYVTGTKYSVKTANDKRKNSYRWSSEKSKQEYDITPIRVEYHTT